MRSRFVRGGVQVTCLLTLLAAVRAAEPVPMDLQTSGVRLLLGVTDKEPAAWDGSVKLTAGEIRRIDPWRFRPDDAILGRSGWKTSSHLLAKPDKNPQKMSPTGVVLTLAAPPSAELEVETVRGKWRVALSELTPGKEVPFLDGRVLVDAVAPAVQLTDDAMENDYPAAATASNGTIWVAFVEHAHRGPADLQCFEKAPSDFSFLVPQGGGDQVAVARFDGKNWSPPVAISAAGLDVWRPAIAVDGQGLVRVVWSQNDGSNWDLYERTIEPGEFPKIPPAAPRRLTTDPGADVYAVLATDKAGRVWMAWQGWRNGQADIYLMPLAPAEKDGARRGSSVPAELPTQPIQVTNSPADEWSPALAADSKGRLHVGYDTYAAGNYDVYLRTFADGKLGPPVAIATSSHFEASPSIVCDKQDRIWVAYEERGSEWGKDTGPLAAVEGAPLYMRGASIQVRVLQGSQLVQPTAELMQNFPTAMQRLNGYPRIALDGNGRPWVVFRHRHEAVWGGNPAHIMAGGVWLEYAISFDGRQWTAPSFLAASDNLLDVRPALAQTASGRLLAIYPSDGRLRHEVIGSEAQRKVFFVGGGVSVSGQVKNDLFAAALPQLPALQKLNLAAAVPETPGSLGLPDTVGQGGPKHPQTEAGPKGVHPQGAADVKRMRDYVIEAGGKKYHLLRGEFHRHTEISMDGGSDGSLEDMWRYALDAAAFEWIGCGDHDLGGGREYPWWIVQKTTDIFTAPPRFVPMYTFERSVPYPNGHRNAMFDHRGVRTCPRLLGDDPGGVSSDDAKMFYAYLHQLHGICASHTSGTGMGTDWRDNDPVAEPVVEIYQGDRNSYEALGGPRVAAKAQDAFGGYKPLGIVWNALAMGYKLGFQSSSDHWSTHISYAVAVAEDHTRPAILDAFRHRHCYAATDNIVLDMRMGEHLMGDEFVYQGKAMPAVSVRIHGTAPLARVDLIKDFVCVYSLEPKQPTAQFTWTDHDSRPGVSWYYVRVLQTDGQVAWASPIWMTVPKRKG